MLSQHFVLLKSGVYRGLGLNLFPLVVKIHVSMSMKISKVLGKI